MRRFRGRFNVSESLRELKHTFGYGVVLHKDCTCKRGEFMLLLVDEFAYCIKSTEVNNHRISSKLCDFKGGEAIGEEVEEKSDGGKYL